MSSDFQTPIGTIDISIIRNALRHTGFRYEAPMCDLDRDAARLAMRLYQQGVRTDGELVFAVSLWGETVLTGPRERGLEGARP